MTTPDDTSMGDGMPRHGGRRSLLLVVLCCALLAACGSPAAPPKASPSSSSEPPTTSPSATATAAPTVDPAADLEARVDALLAGLTPRQQLAQLFVVGVPLDDLGSADELVADGVGGVFLRGRSTISATDLQALTSGWTAAAALRPWVAVDQEGGQVQTLSGPGFPELPPAVEQGALDAASLAALADGLGASLAAAGITLDLAPVADVVPAGSEDSNPPIGGFGRQYGSTAAAVEAAAGAVLAGLRTHGVTGAVKHFPGLGSVTANTDDTGTVVDDVVTADSEQVQAFGRLAASPSVPMVMTSSATYELLDAGGPAAFSPAIVTDLLRGQLGFTGAVISDDLGAASVVQDVPASERAVRFLAAGGTLVLTVTPSVYPAMVDAVEAQVAADPAFAATVQQAVRTALRTKLVTGLVA